MTGYQLGGNYPRYLADTYDKIQTGFWSKDKVSERLTDWRNKNFEIGKEAIVRVIYIQKEMVFFVKKIP